MDSRQFRFQIRHLSNCFVIAKTFFYSPWAGSSRDWPWRWYRSGRAPMACPARIACREGASRMPQTTLIHINQIWNILSPVAKKLETRSKIIPLLFQFQFIKRRNFIFIVSVTIPVSRQFNMTPYHNVSMKISVSIRINITILLKFQSEIVTILNIKIPVSTPNHYSPCSSHSPHRSSVPPARCAPARRAQRRHAPPDNELIFDLSLLSILSSRTYSHVTTIKLFFWDTIGEQSMAHFEETAKVQLEA